MAKGSGTTRASGSRNPSGLSETKGGNNRDEVSGWYMRSNGVKPGQTAILDGETENYLELSDEKAREVLTADRNIFREDRRQDVADALNEQMGANGPKFTARDIEINSEPDYNGKVMITAWNSDERVMRGEPKKYFASVTVEQAFTGTKRSNGEAYLSKVDGHKGYNRGVVYDYKYRYKVTPRGSKY